jgi:hypothetical protein
MTRHVKRSRRWSKREIAATPSEFRSSLSTASKDSTRLAKHAGKRLAHQLAGTKLPWHQWRVKDLHPIQIEQWRRRFGVPKNRTNVMLMVAWSELRKFHMRHSLFVPKKQSDEPRIHKSAAWRKAEKKRNRRRASIFTCVHDKPYYRVCVACKRNKNEARARLELILQKHLFPDLLRWLNTKPLNAEFWIKLRRKLGLVQKSRAYQPARVSFRRFMRRRRRSLDRMLEKPMLTQSGTGKTLVAGSGVPNIAFNIPPLPQRLVEHEVAYSQTLCVAMKTPTHTIEQRRAVRCNRPVSRGVFCDGCLPKPEREGAR